MKEYSISHLVKSEDLNHHGTLFAGRSAEWLVESAFVAAATEHGKPQNILCVNLHGFVFRVPVQKGTILTYRSRVAKVGRTSITVYVKAVSEIEKIEHVDGFITFVCVESGTENKVPCGIVLDNPASPEEAAVRERAAQL